MAAPTDLIFDLVKSDEISDVLAIELEGFPLDEAADLEKFRFRQEQAPDLFFGAFVPKEGGKRKIIGYICSTLSSAKTLTHESMSTHVPSSSTICIHSVCVEKSSRGKGIATRLLKEYVSRLRARVQTGSVPYERIALISHEELIPFYENGGFTSLGKSEVVHGSLPWYELQVELKDGADSVTASENAAPSLPSPVTGGVAEGIQGNQQIPAGLWEALSRGSSRSNRPNGMLLSSFDKPMVSVTIEANQGTLVNKYDLLCPRPGCGSVILKEGVGEWVEKASEQLQPPEVLLDGLLAPLPPPGETTQWWLITPSPMAFENIGFSKSVGHQGSRRKLLACAECDLGPLGWSKEGGTEFWLACSRVAYRT